MVAIRPTSTVGTTPGTGTITIVGSGTHYGATSDNTDTSYSRIQTTGATNAYVTYGYTSIPAGSVVTSIQGVYRIGSTTSWYSQIDTGPGSFSTGAGSANGGSITTYNGSTYTSGFYTGSGAITMKVGTTAASADLRVYELTTNISYYSPPGTPFGLAPSTSVTGTRKPLFTWSHAGGTSNGLQRGFRVRVFTLAQATLGGFDPATFPATLDSGVITSSVSQWLASSNLVNGETYRFYVQTFNGTDDGAFLTDPGAWSPYAQFSINIVPPTPTALTPANATTVVTSSPAVGASVAAMTDGVLIKREWTLAEDSAFTTNPLTIIEDALATTKSGTYAFPPLPARLDQGLWYIRCRTVDQYGITSAWTAYNSFTVAHTPATGSHFPTAGQSLTYAGTKAVTWAFQSSDLNSYQTKYQAELWKATAPGSPISSGEVTSPNGTHTFTIPDATWKGVELRWRVRVTDEDGVLGNWSLDQVFYLYDAPVAALTLPTEAQVLTSAQPTFTWTFTAAGRTQALWRVTVNRVSDGALIADSGQVSGTALSWQVPSPVIQVSTSYTVTVTATDSVGLTTSDSNAFTSSYSAPPSPLVTITGTNFDVDGSVFIDWTASSVSGTCLGWRVYRRFAGDQTWNLVTETAVAVKTYYDYLCPAGQDIEYSVVQVSESFGDPVESAYPIYEFYGDGGYFLVCPDLPSINLKVWSVNSDEFEDEQEMAALNLIGRGRRVEYGTRYGQSGSLTMAFRDQTGSTARSQRLALEALRDSQRKVYLRNPFGDVWAVALQSARVSRVAGVGLQEVATATISYLEISA
jgi:hypothetical protein